MSHEPTDPTPGTTVLIAEDDPASRRLLQTVLHTWGHQVVATEDGEAAWSVLCRDDAPELAILDWGMPGLDGPTLCRMARELGRGLPPYLMLVTARAERADIIAGLAAGADDYVIKPFDREELRARVRVGLRTIGLRRQLAARVQALESALARVRLLEDLLRVCAWCRKVRDGEGAWQPLEAYVAARTRTTLTHTICPDCLTATRSGGGPAGETR